MVDRLALLRGTNEEERRALDAAWTQPDRARHRAASPTPPPVPIVSAALESNPEPPAPKPSDAPDPNPTAAQAPCTRRCGAPVPLLATAIALVMLILTAALLTHPTHTASAPAPAPSAPERTTVPSPSPGTSAPSFGKAAADPPTSWDRAPGPSPVAADSGAWAKTHDVMHGGEALARITVQGRSPSDAVIFHALHVRLVDRAAPLPWNAYRMNNGCSGAITPHHFAVDLDRPRPLARPVDGLGASGAEVRKNPAVSLPCKVTSSMAAWTRFSPRRAG